MLRATIVDIQCEAKAYVVPRFTITNENLQGKNLRFTLSRGENVPTPDILRTQNDMTYDNGKAMVQLSVDDTDVIRAKWYEFWVEWQTGQWQKEFKGKFNASRSADYNP